MLSLFVKSIHFIRLELLSVFTGGLGAFFLKKIFFFNFFLIVSKIFYKYKKKMLIFSKSSRKNLINYKYIIIQNLVILINVTASIHSQFAYSTDTKIYLLLNNEI
jgi:hypothetical protein